MIDWHNEYLTPESWGEGEWLNEPGLNEEVQFEYRGHLCIARRNWMMGNWNAYVAIPVDKYKEEYDDLEAHGGITWNEPYLPWERPDDGTWRWIGFDCGHYRDYAPRHAIIEKKIIQPFSEQKSDQESHAEYLKYLDTVSRRKEYRTLEYVKNVCKTMIDQIEGNEDKE